MVALNRKIGMAVLAALPEAEGLGVLSQPVDLGAEPKDIVQVLPLGPFIYANPAYNGGKPVHFDVTPDAVQALIVSKEAADVVVDYEHQTLGPGEAPASGWIKELIDGGERGLLGRVDWTLRAKALIAAKEYRYLSPVVLRGMVSKDELGKIVPWYLHSVALVNRPYLGKIEPVAAKHTATNPEVLEMKTLIAWLVASMGMKLDANATEDQVVAALKQALGVIAASAGLPADTVTLDALSTAIAAMKQQAASDAAAMIATLRQDLGLKETDGLSVMQGTIAALKQGHEGHGTLAVEFAALKQQLADKDAEEAVTAACNAGKVTPATRDSMLAWAKKDLTAFQTFVAKAPVVAPPSRVADGAPPADGGGAPDEAAIAVAKMFGNSTEDLKKYGGTSAQE